MRICIVGDQHFRPKLAYADALESGRQDEWKGILDKIVETAKNCDAVVLMGDNLNSKNNPSLVLKEFVEFLNRFADQDVHILVGNHERQGTGTALDFLQKIEHPNWHVYSEPTLVKIAGQEAMMIPYMTPALLGVEIKEEGIRAIIDAFPKYAIPLAFAHHGVTGSKIHGMMIDFFNEIVLPKEEMDKHFSHSFFGHVHGKQNLFPNVYGTGSIMTQEVGEHDKSIWVYESDGTMNVKVEEIPLPVRGIYKIIWEERDSMEIIPSNSIVKCYVTDKKTDIDEVKKFLENFDASVVIEQYPNERSKVHFEDGGIDLSVDSLLKLYADAKSLDYSDLKEGFELIK